MFVVRQQWMCRHRVLCHFVVSLLVIMSPVVGQTNQSSDTNFNNMTDGRISPQDVRIDQLPTAERNHSTVNVAITKGVESEGISTGLRKESNNEEPTLASNDIRTENSRSPYDDRSTFSGSTKTKKSTIEGRPPKGKEFENNPFVSQMSFSSTTPLALARSEETSFDGNPGQHCEELREFTEMFNLCDPYQDLDSYDSCEGRCGQVLPFDEAIGNCSCDANCFAYYDCCVDFSLHCPDLFSHGRGLGNQFSFSYSCSLQRMPYNLISTCEQATRSTKLSTSMDPWTWSSTPSVLSNRSKLWPEGPQRKFTGLEHYSQTYNFVADLATGLVYGGVSGYECNADADSTPYFLPYVLPLTSSYVAGESIESYVFPHSPLYYYDPYILRPDPLLRACFSVEAIHCSECWEKFEVPVTPFCHYLKMHNSMLKVKIPIDYHQQGRQQLNHYGSCTHFVRDQVSTGYWTRGYTPSYVSPAPSSWTAARRQYEETVRNLGRMVTIKRSSFTSSEYILEFEGAPWKTIRCSDPSLSLDDCDITECSLGYVSMEEQRCIQPTTIEAFTETKELKEHDAGSGRIAGLAVSGLDLPLCLCFAVYTALKDTKIWSMGKLYRNNSACVYEINNVLSGKVQANESDMATFQEVFRHALHQHQAVCTEQYNRINTCFKHINVTGSKCFTFTYDEIRNPNKIVGNTATSVIAALSDPHSQRLHSGLLRMLTLFVIHCYL